MQPPSMRPRRSRKKVAGTIIAAAIAVFLLVVFLPPLFNVASKTANPPNIQLTNVSQQSSGCFLVIGYYSVTFRFTLVNAGSINGFATVGLYIDSSLHGSNRYYVSAGQSLQESMSADVHDCNPHSASIAIIETSQ